MYKISHVCLIFSNYMMKSFYQFLFFEEINKRLAPDILTDIMVLILPKGKASLKSYFYFPAFLNICLVG